MRLNLYRVVPRAKAVRAVMDLPLLCPSMAMTKVKNPLSDALVRLTWLETMARSLTKMKMRVEGAVKRHPKLTVGETETSLIDMVSTIESGQVGSVEAAHLLPTKMPWTVTALAIISVSMTSEGIRVDAPAAQGRGLLVAAIAATAIDANATKAKVVKNAIVPAAHIVKKTMTVLIRETRPTSSTRKRKERSNWKPRKSLQPSLRVSTW